MAWTTPRTWVAGETVTAAIMNTHVRDNLNWLVNPPIFEATQATGQAVANNTVVGVAFDTNVIDTHSGHSTSTNNTRYTPQQAGWYRVGGASVFPSNATGRRLSLLYFNGAAVSRSQHETPPIASGFSTDVACLPTKLQFNGTTDYVELATFQSSGGSLTLVNGLSTFSAEFLHS